MNFFRKVKGLLFPFLTPILSHKLFFGSYKGASRQTRQLGTYRAALTSANAELQPFSRNELVSRSRDLYRNNPIARAAVSRVVLAAVGSGLRLQSHIDYRSLNVEYSQVVEKEREIERLFRQWAEDQNECDLEKTLDFYGLQRLVLTSMLLSGDVFCLTPFVRRSFSKFHLRLQIIESDRVSNPHHTIDTENLRNGIQYNRLGEPVSIHVLESHPGDFLPKSLKWKKIRVFGRLTGRRRVLQIYEKERPEQARGVPFLSSVIEPLKQLDRYIDAEIDAAVISSFFTAFLKGDEELGPMAPTPPGGDAPIEPYSLASEEIRMGSGAIVELPSGVDVSFANPQRPNANFERFFESVMKNIAAALNMPFEELLLHYSSSYSAARAAMLQAWRGYTVKRAIVVSQFCQPIFELFLDDVVSSGLLDLPGFEAKRAAYIKTSWIGPTRGQIDPLKEIKAAKERIEARISSRTREATEILGEDWEMIEQQLEREEELLRQTKAVETVEIVEAVEAVKIREK